MADIRAHVLHRAFRIEQRLKFVGKIVAVIHLFLQQSLRRYLAELLALRAVYDGVLFNLPGAGH